MINYFRYFTEKLLVLNVLALLIPATILIDGHWIYFKQRKAMTLNAINLTSTGVNASRACSLQMVLKIANIHVQEANLYTVNIQSHLTIVGISYCSKSLCAMVL